MSGKKTVSRAELLDKGTWFTALAMFFLSLAAAASAARYFTSDKVDAYLNIAEKGAAALVLGVLLIGILPVAIKKRSLDRQSHVNHADGFMNNIAKKAAHFSWFITFVLLIFLPEGLLAKMPGEYLFDVAIAIMAGSFSIGFFVLNGRDDKDDFGDVSEYRQG